MINWEKIELEELTWSLYLCKDPFAIKLEVGVIEETPPPPPPPMDTLDILISEGGTTIPSAGNYNLSPNFRVEAIPKPGYRFDHFRLEPEGIDYPSNPIYLTL